MIDALTTGDGSFYLVMDDEGARVAGVDIASDDGGTRLRLADGTTLDLPPLSDARVRGPGGPVTAKVFRMFGFAVRDSYDVPVRRTAT